MGNIADRQPNVVQVTRLPKGPGDLGPREHFVGHLVDEYGNDVETPEIGYPIYLGGEDDDKPWLFATDPVYKLHVFITHWKVMTENGTEYEIRSDRQVQ
jgi:hypothetical protein